MDESNLSYKTIGLTLVSGLLTIGGLIINLMAMNSQIQDQRDALNDELENQVQKRKGS